VMAILPRDACRLRMNDDPEVNAALFEGATRALALRQRDKAALTCSRDEGRYLR